MKTFLQNKVSNSTNLNQLLLESYNYHAYYIQYQKSLHIIIAF